MASVFALGTTFCLKATGAHLRVIVSDPEQFPHSIVIVSVTTSKAYKERACVIARGAHPFVTHESCIDYKQSFVASLDELYDGKDKGLLEVREPMPLAIVESIWRGVASTDRMPQVCERALRDQGHIE